MQNFPSGDMERKMAAIKVDRQKAKALLVQVGLKTAARYGDEKLTKMLNGLTDDDAADAGKYQKMYDRIVKGVTAGKEIELTGSAEAPPKPDEPTKPKATGKGVRGKGKRDSKGFCAKDYMYLSWEKFEDGTSSTAIFEDAKPKIEADPDLTMPKTTTVGSWCVSFRKGFVPAGVVKSRA